MASFPALFSGSVALYPLTEETHYPVGILTHNNSSEQRWKDAAALARFVLHCDGIKKADRDLIQNFYDSVKGPFDKTWDITIGGTLYSNMVFDDDRAFSPRETDAEHWTFELPCHQVRKN